MMILIYLLILSVTNVFGITNILEVNKLPVIGVFSNFILILLNILVFITLLIKKKKLTNIEKKFVKFDLILLAYFFFLIFYSSIITGRESFSNALSVGGIYIYYSAFLFPIFLLNTQKDFYKFINFLRIGGIITGCIAIISYIVGYSIVTGVFASSYNHYIVRVFQVGFFNYFVIVFWTIQFITKSSSNIKIHYAEFIISILGIILFFGRTRIFVLGLMILSVFVILSHKSFIRKNILFYIFVIIVSMPIAVYVININILDLIQRFQEGYANTESGTGTLVFRMYAISLGYNIFSQMPIFGTGFINQTSSYYSQLVVNTGIHKGGYAITNNADFGLASILFTTGIIGFGLITYFVVSFLIYIKKQIYKFKKVGNYDDKFVYSLTVSIIVTFVFFVEQISGNAFAFRNVTLYMLSMSFAIKILSENNFIKG